MNEIETLRTERAAKLNEARAIHAKGEAEKRALTPEEQTAFDNLVAEVDDHEMRISELEAAAPAPATNSADAGTTRSAKLAELDEKSKKVSTRKSAPIEAPAFVRDLGDRQATADRALALRGWLGFHSVNGASDAQRLAAQRSGLELGNNRASSSVPRLPRAKPKPVLNPYPVPLVVTLFHRVFSINWKLPCWHSVGCEKSQPLSELAKETTCRFQPSAIIPMLERSWLKIPRSLSRM
jgi:hypothetical protein